MTMDTSDSETRLGMDLISTSHLRVRHGFRLWEHKKLLKTFVRELGHPLGGKVEIDRALEAIDKTTALHVVVNNNARSTDARTVIQFTPWHSEE
jgi:hypothetical protein